ncbi:hypothetical protein I6E29_01835 [Arcanobacterium haemolyticum]|nr:hypothetical protein [Arcanobacterium haemolyticum]
MRDSDDKFPRKRDSSRTHGRPQRSSSARRSGVSREADARRKAAAPDEHVSRGKVTRGDHSRRSQQSGKPRRPGKTQRVSENQRASETRGVSRVRNGEARGQRNARRLPRTTAGRAGGRESSIRRERPRVRSRRSLQSSSVSAMDFFKSRRGITLLVVVVMLIAVIAVGNFVTGQLQARSDSARVDPTALYTPVACEASQVRTEMETSNSDAGAPVTFTVTLTNTSQEHPCWIDTGWAHVNVDVSSGSAHLASTKDCQAGSESKTLLLDRGMTTSFSVVWNGGIGSGCVSPSVAPAQPGTYSAELTFGESAAQGAKIGFVLE